MSHFSDEFVAYAKEEDEINHQHTSNWIVCYVIITIIPIVFIGCAWWSNHQRKAAKTVHKRGRRRDDTDSVTQKAQTESIEMRDLEAAHTTPALTVRKTTAATTIASPATTAWPGMGMGMGMGTRTAPPESGSRAASMASDTGAVVGGDAFEDVDLAEGGSSRWLQRGGREGPVPSWLRRTTLPGESSAFKFQPEGSNWSGCEDHTEERSE